MEVTLFKSVGWLLNKESLRTGWYRGDSAFKGKFQITIQITEMRAI